MGFQQTTLGGKTVVGGKVVTGSGPNPVTGIAIVNVTGASSGSMNLAGAFSPTITASMNTTGSTLLVAGVVCASSTAVASMCDKTSSGTCSSSLNTWTSGNVITVTGDAILQPFWVPGPTTSTTHFFTAACTGSSVRTMVSVVAASGTLTTAGVLDQQAAGGTSGAATTIQPGSITPAQTGELLFLICTDDTATVTAWTVNDSFTYGTDTVGWWSTAEGYLIDSTSAAINPTCSWGGTTAALGAAEAAFKHP
jgi:hypothetical protein